MLGASRDQRHRGKDRCQLEWAQSEKEGGAVCILESAGNRDGEAVERKADENDERQIGGQPVSGGNQRYRFQITHRDS